LLSIIGKEEQGGDQDMMCLLQLTVTARDSIYCPVEGYEEGRRRGGSKLRCSNCYARMTRKVTRSRSKRRRRKRRRRRGKMRSRKGGKRIRIRRREGAGDGE
jgi:hypothetical protein